VTALLRRVVAAASVTLALAAAAPPARAAPPGSPWGEKYFPDVQLLTHDGRKVRFYSDLVKDKHVVVMFIYTRCPKVCGLMTANLVRVQKELGDRVGKGIHFYSVSLEPENDTPATLAAYAAAYRTGPGWTFLTGRPEDVALLRRKFGDLAPVEDHAPRVNIGNDVTGQWWSTSAVENPKYLATVIGSWMDPGYQGSAEVAKRDYGKVPAVAPEPPGGKLFRQKCAACHLPGGGSVGPELRGVVALRGEAWIRRWVKEPDAMLREKDPVALALLARHGNVPMPNVGLSDAEVDAVVAFLKASSETAAPVEAPAADGTPETKSKASGAPPAGEPVAARAE
jgi:protein SCO1/2